MASVEIDNDDYRAMQRTIATFKGNKTVIRQATNDTLGGIRTESVRLIGAKVTASAATIRATFTIKRMFASDMTASITSKGKSLPLIKYSLNQIKKNWGPNAGISVKLLEGGPRSIIKHAFVATMRSGHRGAFWRVHNVGGGARPFDPGFKYGIFKQFYGSRMHPARYIHELYGPPIPEIYDDPDIQRPVFANANTRLQARIRHHTNRLIDRAR